MGARNCIFTFFSVTEHVCAIFWHVGLTITQDSGSKRAIPTHPSNPVPAPLRPQCHARASHSHVSKDLSLCFGRNVVFGQFPFSTRNNPKLDVVKVWIVFLLQPLCAISGVHMPHILHSNRGCRTLSNKEQSSLLPIFRGGQSFFLFSRCRRLETKLHNSPVPHLCAFVAQFSCFYHQCSIHLDAPGVCTWLPMKNCSIRQVFSVRWAWLQILSVSGTCGANYL
jgi:hypothetical protein|mmetsp:Transcript_72234/g.121238  ORF Transcript_72234/g.121238 Transcript_72234/m.121238 type:complete len:224 (+) Transcript_72234:180-851(+)